MNDSLWVDFYQSDRTNTSKVFVKIMTSDGSHFFFSDYNEWWKVKSHCENKSAFIEDLHLQFRTHKCIIDVAKAEGVYLVRSVLGAIGMKTNHYYTIGIVNGDKVDKQMWIVPELIKEKEYVDTLDNCFQEAIIYNAKKRKNRKKQVQT
jgi:hypothetical protein